MRSFRSQRAGAVLAAGVLLLAAGCTSDDEPTPSGSSAPDKGSASASTSQGAGLPSGVTPAPIPTEVENNVDLRKDVAITSCKATADGWGADGTVKNSGADARTYTITVFFTTAQATTVDSAATKVDVAPGETKKWTAAKKFTAADTMLCVLRAVS